MICNAMVVDDYWTQILLNEVHTPWQCTIGVPKSLIALSPLRALSSVFSVILGGLGLGWAPARKVGGMTNQYGWRASP